MSNKAISIESIHLNKAIVEQSVEAISVADLEGNYLFANPVFCALMGYNLEELTSKTVFDMKAPEQDHSSFEKSKSDDNGHVSQVMLQKKDGTVFLSEVTGKKLHLENETIVLGIIKDITKSAQVEKELKKSQEINYMAMQVANDGVWDWHMDTNLVEFDERYYTLAGYEKDEFSYSFDEWAKRVHADDIANSVEQFERYLAGEIDQYDVEFRFLCKDTSYMWIRARGKIVTRDEMGKPLRFVGTHSDITLQKEHENITIYQAHYDALTKLPNRLLSLDRLHQQCIKAKREKTHVALLFIDLDNFKVFNDTLGHDTGDLILVEAANRIANVLRNSDTVGRLGGDEFVVILGDVGEKSDLQKAITAVLRCFNAPFEILKRELSLSVSIGISIYPNDGDTSSELLKNADTAMYDAKAKGKNTYRYFTNEMNELAKSRFVLEEEMRKALENNEFRVYYQPKVDTQSQEIIGAEALLRWSNPTLGNVSPADFIPIAEQTGLIVEIGKYVLKEAISNACRWKDISHKDIQIAVNLSPLQFRDPELLGYIQMCIDEYGFNASLLELEITEGVLMSGFSHIEMLLDEIHTLGIQIAMDDFGTGYSSLSYLRNYPFDVLKIDKSFIDNIVDNDADKALVTASIAMSKALKLKIVAEGIETYEQFEVLKSLECDCIQGFFFDKALSVEEFTLRIREKNVYAARVSQV